ncbi:deoxyribodipyrimidine photo-lyase [Pseudomonas sp. GD03842]|uniref:deoxyribodipyrimidine photo-lyase n=1 Tax=Pseudomonas sp. GD03842 TaxID=2975385 RepID=UPI00244CC338|nr:deoxyribodipyrimidine photo-lyase [Pseudomonas sp. GD03842]MDH0746136.1 deoxyribodipyrimidine photo-lyase [Pseudomonas sp. GD03842]
MQLFWLRTDLRTHDNTALNAAMKQGPTVAAFMISPEQWRRHDEASCKVDFWLRNLAVLKDSLKALNIPLLIVNADTWDKAPQALLELCQTHGIEHVHVNEEYGVNEEKRDKAVEAMLDKHGIGFDRYLDQLLFKPGSVLTKSGNYFKVYTQFRKVCYERLHHSIPPVARLHKPQAAVRIKSDDIPKQVKGFTQPSEALRNRWPAGEDEARKRLAQFTDDQVHHYEDERDFPARPGTSQLSAYLAAGVVSARQCLHAALSSNNGEFETGNVGAVTWINELLWREFYKHVLVGFPRVSRHRAFRPETEALKWRHAPKDLQAWQEGRTGLPIVDAAMRQLLETGWMHNRLRMITAMFLTKNLLIDWREGERFFMQHLIDGDLAANNGGWQWSSSTGTDSSPYFRIFNPISQSERFDPQGVFIKQWVPELSELNKRDIHDPSALSGLFGVEGYPSPIVDLKASRERALAAFKSLPHRHAEALDHE